MTIPARPRAVITGAAGGLGRALCLALARRGAHLVASDIDLDGAEETARLVAEAGGVAHAQRCDVSVFEELEELARFAQRELGSIDLIVNNAGVAVGGTFEEIPLADWQWVLSINLWGVIHGCRAFVPRLKQQRSGHILNVASAAGIMSAPEMAPYNVTKAGVVALSETLYNELREFGVGVTALCPTFFQTGLLARTRSQKPELVSTAEALMRRSRVQAPQVAERALAACERGALYCLPMRDAQVGWGLKRLSPEAFYTRLLPGILGALRKRAAGA